MRSDNPFFAFWIVMFFLYFLLSYLPLFFCILGITTLLILSSKPKDTWGAVVAIFRSSSLFYTFLALVLTMMQFPALGWIQFAIVVPFFLLLLSLLLFWDLRTYQSKNPKKLRNSITTLYFKQVLIIFTLELGLAFVLKMLDLTDFSKLYEPQLLVGALLSPFNSIANWYYQLK